MMRATLAYRMFLSEAFEGADERAERGEEYHAKEIPEGAQIAFSRITDAIFEHETVLRVPKNSSYELPFKPFEPSLNSPSVKDNGEMPSPESPSSSTTATTEEKNTETGLENAMENTEEANDTENDNENKEESDGSDESPIMGLVDPRDVMHDGLASFYEDAMAATRLMGHSVSYKLEAILDARISDTHFIQVFNTLAHSIRSMTTCHRNR